MFSINDIYFKMNSGIISQCFWNTDIEGKKELINKKLKKYLTSKIQEVNGSITITDVEKLDFNVSSLLQKLSSIISRDQYLDILRHIIQLASSLQGWSIICWRKDEELSDCSLIEFDENRLWANLKTHENSNYVKTLNYVYGIFNNNFMKENSPKRLKMRLSKNER